MVGMTLGTAHYMSPEQGWHIRGVWSTRSRSVVLSERIP